MSENTSVIGQDIFTVGHSNHPLDRFVSLLKGQDIEVLVDVRSYPYSRYAPHFNDQPLKVSVKAADIKYLFLGKELGGRPKGAEFYDEDGHILYSRVAESPLFIEGITRLETGLQKYRVALMCSEENPSECHRRLLVGRVLGERGVTVRHIRGDGRVQIETELAPKQASHNNYDNVQLSLFNAHEVNTWKSTQSVSQKKQRQNFLGL